MSLSRGAHDGFLRDLRRQHDAMFERIAADMHDAFKAQTRIIIAAMWVGVLGVQAITFVAFHLW
jgi:hypothetical protein